MHTKTYFGLEGVWKLLGVKQCCCDDDFLHAKYINIDASTEI